MPNAAKCRRKACEACSSDNRHEAWDASRLVKRNRLLGIGYAGPCCGCEVAYLGGEILGSAGQMSGDANIRRLCTRHHAVDCESCTTTWEQSLVNTPALFHLLHRTHCSSTRTEAPIDWASSSKPARIIRRSFFTSTPSLQRNRCSSESGTFPGEVTPCSASLECVLASPEVETSG